ncbi:MAG: ROK family protein [Polyangiaceae bacterium]
MARTTATKSASPRTLAVDIGGTGTKALVLDPRGKPVTERVREETPRPATPAAVLAVVHRLIAKLPAFHRVSVGFPGVVVDGVTMSAPNLDPAWRGFDLARALAKRTRKPVRVLNDAGVQGFGIVQGRGVEVVLTLGTGMGCALFVDGRYVPNVELAHHPFSKGRTYEETVGNRALEDVGKKRWNKRVAKVLEQVDALFNPRVIYLGGGNTEHLRIALPENVRVRSNVAGLTGGIALWNAPR